MVRSWQLFQDYYLRKCLGGGLKASVARTGYRSLWNIWVYEDIAILVGKIKFGREWRGGAGVRTGCQWITLLIDNPGPLDTLAVDDRCSQLAGCKLECG